MSLPSFVNNVSLIASHYQVSLSDIEPTQRRTQNTIKMTVCIIDDLYHYGTN